MNYRRVILGLPVSVALVMYILCSFAQAATTAENYLPPQQASWINPVYINHPDILGKQPRQAQATVNSVSVSNLDGLRTALRQSFYQRETVLNYIYTGASSDITEASLTSLIDAIMAEDDYLKFSFGGWNAGWGGYEGSLQIDITVSYLTTLEQENYVNQRVAQILPVILDPCMNEDQIEKAIHDYIVLNVAYDTTYQEHSAYAALAGGRTVCQGYALLAYKMLSQAGLQARIIGGTGHGESHAWNMVQVNSSWYNLDCTWDDPTPDRPGEVQYDYYNLNDAELSLDHTPDIGTYPSANTSYFQTLTALIQTSTDQADIYQRLRQELELVFLLSERTAANATELEAKWLAAAQHADSEFKVRYFGSSGTLSATLNPIFNRVAQQTSLNSYQVGYGVFNRGGQSGYLLLKFALSYTTANQAPTVSGTTISGTPQPGQKLTGSYQYSDVNSDPEGLSLYQWYRGTQAGGTDKVAIPGAIGRSYTVNNNDVGRYLFFSVQPAAAQGNLIGSASGVSTGTLVQSTVQTTNVSLVPALSDIQVARGTSRDSLNLPATANITLSSGSQISCSLIWDNGTPAYDANQTGTYTFSGSLQLPSGVNNPSNLKASVNVSVIEQTDNCFIATAAFGSKYAWPVTLLRHFRDQYLLTNHPGRAFVSFYYRHSPPLASYIAGKAWLKQLVRLLLAPLVAAVYLLYHPICWLGISLLLALLVLYRRLFRQTLVDQT